MNIPEEIVEKAAEAIRETAKTHPRPRSIDGPAQLACAQARAALSAAAPYLMATAWDEGNRFGIDKHCEQGCYEDATTNPYRTKESL